MQQQSMTRRRFLSRSAIVGAAVIGGPTLLSACGGGEEDVATLERAREEGFIRVGFANEAPYGFADAAGVLTGESPEVARAVFARLGVEEMDGVLTEFGSLIPGLQARRFDLVAAGMFITPERCEQVLFSDPSYCAPQAFLVQGGNPLGLTDYASVADNPDVRLGVLTGAVEAEQARANGVADGQIETLALTTISLNDLLETAGADSGLEVTDSFIAVIDGEEQLGCGGFAFHQDDEDFRNAFNEVLNEMKQNGELIPIVEGFGFAEAAEAGTDVTAEELCG
jgi:polar amino acid transport system substrate-binding protein